MQNYILGGLDRFNHKLCHTFSSCTYDELGITTSFITDSHNILHNTQRTSMVNHNILRYITSSNSTTRPLYFRVSINVFSRFPRTVVEVRPTAPAMEFLFRSRSPGKRQVKPSQDVALLEEHLAADESSDEEFKIDDGKRDSGDDSNDSESSSDASGERPVLHIILYHLSLTTQCHRFG